MITEIKGDAVKALKDGDISILIHQVNCQGVMGSGIAGQIRKEFPEHYTDYLEYVESNTILSKTQKLLLGTFLPTYVGDYKTVYGLFSQDNYGSDKKLYTNYAAFTLGLDAILRNYQSSTVKIGIPAFIGCGLGGGDWDIIKPIIEYVASSNDVDVYLYSLV